MVVIPTFLLTQLKAQSKISVSFLCYEKATLQSAETPYKTVVCRPQSG